MKVCDMRRLRTASALRVELKRRNRPERQVFSKVVNCVTLLAVLMVLWQNRSIGEITADTNARLQAHDKLRIRDQQTLIAIAEESVADVVAALIGAPYAF